MPFASRVDPDETAPTGAVSSGSTLFAYGWMSIRVLATIETTEILVLFIISWHILINIHEGKILFLNFYGVKG